MNLSEISDKDLLIKRERRESLINHYEAQNPAPMDKINESLEILININNEIQKRFL